MHAENWLEQPLSKRQAITRGREVTTGGRDERDERDKGMDMIRYDMVT